MFRKWSGLALCLSTALALLGTQPVLARGANDEQSTALPVIALQALPQQGQHVWRLIHAGGPFPYEKDGTVFGNRERLLPLQKRGYYREYTVPTPGVTHRGARRIVCGGLQPQIPEACYYTADHYTSFQKIVK